MGLSFDDLANHFDDQRGLPVAALREWSAAVDLFAAGRTLEIVEPGIGTGRVTARKRKRKTFGAPNPRCCQENLLLRQAPTKPLQRDG